MNYYDALELNKIFVLKKMEDILRQHKVEQVGFSECIVMRENVEDFIEDLSMLGILIEAVYWWCYVNPKEADKSGCPHGMGGPRSLYYDGWFSELQNDGYIPDKHAISRIIKSYDKRLIYRINMKTLAGLRMMLKKPFKYTPTAFIECNRCVNPALWLLVPNEWNKSKNFS